jgi:hypothetical protein
MDAIFNVYGQAVSPARQINRSETLAKELTTERLDNSATR